MICCTLTSRADTAWSGRDHLGLDREGTGNGHTLALAAGRGCGCPVEDTDRRRRRVVDFNTALQSRPKAALGA